MGMVTNLILSNKSEQNINLNIDSEAKAVAKTDANANATALATAEASATSEANVEASLEQRWVLVGDQWQLLLGQLTLRNVCDRTVPQLPELFPTSPQRRPSCTIEAI